MIICLLFPVSAYSNSETPELKISEISKGVYIHQSFHRTHEYGVVSANGLVVTEGSNAFIVDTPWSDKDTEALVRWISNKNYKLLGSVSTHSHEDRTAGIKWLNNRSIPTYATKLTNDLLSDENKELAKFTLKENDEKLADGLIEAFYPGEGHTVDNIVVWLPKSKILFGGCFTRSLESKGLGYTGEAFIEQWPSSVERVLLKYSDAEQVVPGHGKIGNLELLIHTKMLAETAFKQLISTNSNAQKK